MKQLHQVCSLRSHAEVVIALRRPCRSDVQAPFTALVAQQPLGGILPLGVLRNGQALQLTIT